MKTFLNATLSTLVVAFCGTSVLAQDDVQPVRTMATYGNWSINCNLVTITNADQEPTKQEICEMVSRVNIRGEDGVTRPLIQVAIGKLPGQESTRILFQVPGNAYLRNPVAMLIDPAEGAVEGELPANALTASYVRCNAGTCIADADLSDDDQSRLSAAQTAIVSFVNVTGNRIGVPLSMNGFRDASKAMNK